jgi:hypothetical protein
MHLDPTLIVVADREAVRFFLRASWRDPLEEMVDLSDSADFLDIRHDAPTDAGLAYPTRTKPSAKELQRDKVESVFLHRVAAATDRAMSEYRAQGLVLCAPARELCLLRDFIAANSRAKLSCEITADLVKAKKAIIEAAMHRIKA